MAGSTIYHPVGAAQNPAVARTDSFQIHSAGKTLLRSKRHRVCVGPVNKVLQTSRILPITCSSYKIKTDLTTKVSERSCLLPWCHGVRRCERTSPLNSSPHGRLQLTIDTSTRAAATDATDDSGKEEAETIITEALQIDKAPPAPWIKQFIPDSLWPYAQLARLQRLDGVWLAIWPGIWATCLAGPLGTSPDLKTMGLITLWAFFARAEACIVNDIFDKDVDVQVGRTKLRPLPSGAVTVAQAYAFLALVVALALVVTLPLNNTSRLLAAFDLGLWAIYPLMKRVTHWPQAFLGFAGNVSQLAAWVAIRGNLDPSIILPLFASGVIWYIIFDTIYAHQDRKDDLKAGVKSTAVLFGDRTKIILSGFSVASLALLSLAGFRCGLGWPFYAGVVAAAGHLTWQISTVNLDDPADCGAKFISNAWYGGIVSSALLLGNFVPL